MNALPPNPVTVRTTCPYCGVGCGVLATPDGAGGASIAGDPELFGGPQAEQAVAARHGLELLLLVHCVLLLETFFTLVECRHVRGSDLYAEGVMAARCGNSPARLDN